MAIVVAKYPLDQIPFHASLLHTTFFSLLYSLPSSFSFVVAAYLGAGGIDGHGKPRGFDCGQLLKYAPAHGCMRLETGLTIRILRYLSNIYEDIPN